VIHHLLWLVPAACVVGVIAVVPYAMVKQTIQDHKDNVMDAGLPWWPAWGAGAGLFQAAVDHRNPLMGIACGLIAFFFIDGFLRLKNRNRRR
jgi:hypothetical protein